MQSAIMEYYGKAEEIIDADLDSDFNLLDDNPIVNKEENVNTYRKGKSLNFSSTQHKDTQFSNDRDWKSRPKSKFS
jgi:hypothetical protein